jgi:hypothetical protein
MNESCPVRSEINIVMDVWFSSESVNLKSKGFLASHSTSVGIVTGWMVEILLLAIHTAAQGSTQPLTEMSTRNLLQAKG